MVSEVQWQARIEGGLNAHFKQPDGTSRPGTDWTVGLRHGGEMYSIFVRAYLSDDLSGKYRKDTNYQGQTVLGYVFDMLEKGWHPAQAQDILTLTILNPKDDPPKKKSGWKFW
jgi:hypothetical protein